MRAQLIIITRGRGAETDHTRSGYPGILNLGNETGKLMKCEFLTVNKFINRQLESFQPLNGRLES